MQLVVCIVAVVAVVVDTQAVAGVELLLVLVLGQHLVY
jgi:hypothetical protein